LDVRPRPERAHLKQKTAIELGRICRDRIDLLTRVHPLQKAVGASSVRVERNGQDVAVKDGGLALNAQQAGPQIQD
jgi:hypothetical protein